MLSWTLDFVTLPQTDLRVSRCCFGTMTFGGQTDEPAAAGLIRTCLDSGINFFDTANVYNQGASETILGRILKDRRRDVVLASKVRGRMGEAPDESGLSRHAILKQCEASLKRLGTDWLDICYLHQPDYDVEPEETLAATDQLQREGKVRYLACSNYSAWQVTELLWIAGRCGYRPPSITQPLYNVLARGIEQEYLPMTRRFHLGNVVYNPLAGGLLTGKQTRGAPLPGTRFDNNQLYIDRYWHAAYFDAVEDLRLAAGREGRSLVSLALNWLLHHSPVDCVILGASRPEQLASNLKTLADGRLSAESLKMCDAIWDDLRGVTPKYNR